MDVLILNTGNTLASVTPAAQSTGLNQPPLVGLDLSSSTTPSSSSSPPTLSLNPFKAKPILPQSGMLVLIFLAFVAGVFSFLSPCTLPILPAYFAITAQSESEIRALLLAVRGLGPWSVEYLLMRGFGLADCVPAGDAALAKSLHDFFELLDAVVLFAGGDRETDRALGPRGLQNPQTVPERGRVGNFDRWRPIRRL